MYSVRWYLRFLTQCVLLAGVYRAHTAEITLTAESTLASITEDQCFKGVLAFNQADDGSMSTDGKTTKIDNRKTEIAHFKENVEKCNNFLNIGANAKSEVIDKMDLNCLLMV